LSRQIRDIEYSLVGKSEAPGAGRPCAVGKQGYCFAVLEDVARLFIGEARVYARVSRARLQDCELTDVKMLCMSWQEYGNHTFFRYECAKKGGQSVGLLMEFCVGDYTPVGPIDSRRNIQSRALWPKACGSFKKLV
jgi:hypothetical protein